MIPFRVSVVDMTGVERSLTQVVGPHATARVAVVSEVRVKSAQTAANTAQRGQLYLQHFFEQFAPTHSHVGDGRYEASTPLSLGRYLLIVTAEDKSPVLQRITVKQAGDVQRVTAGWDNVAANERQNGQVLTVEIGSAAPAKKSQPGSRESMITVKLFPRGEYVIISGTFGRHEVNGKKDGVRFEAFAEGRRNRLWTAGDMRDGDLVTILSCDDRARRTYVKASTRHDRNNSRPAQDWVLVDEIRNPQVRGQFDAEEIPTDIGILDFYAYLNLVGQKQPGTVEEASIFSHAFEGGPILWNTNERTRNPANGRDANDLDGRANDWGPLLMKSFPNLKAAFSPKALLRVWGCNATNLIDKMSNAPGNDAQYYQYDTNKHGARIAERLTGFHALASFKKAAKRAYCFRAAQFLGRPVIGAPPGIGASFGSDGHGNSVTFITRDPNVTDPAAPSIPAKNPVEAGQNAVVKRAFTFLDRHIGPIRTLALQSGFFDFQELSVRIDARLSKIPSPPYSNDRWFLFDDSKDKDEPRSQVRVASGTLVVGEGPSPLPIFNPPGAQAAGITSTGRPGRLFVSSNARVVEIKRLDSGVARLSVVASAGEDCGVLVEDDGALFVLTRPSSGRFTVDTRPIPAKSSTGAPLAPVTDGFVERVKKTFIL